MNNHEISLLTIKKFLINQLIENRNMEIELSKINLENKSIHIINACNYSRKIDKMKKEIKRVHKS